MRTHHPIGGANFDFGGHPPPLRGTIEATPPRFVARPGMPQQTQQPATVADLLVPIASLAARQQRTRVDQGSAQAIGVIQAQA